MYDDILMILLGFCFIVIGILNYKGNINLIHWYNRKRITKETRKPYGKIMGIGTIIIGIGLLITGILTLVLKTNNYDFIAQLSLIIGLILIMYGQFKYNKGLF